MIKRINFFFILYSLFFLAGLLIFFEVEHGEILLWINKNRTNFLDKIMPYLTVVGDGWFYAFCALLFLLINRKIGITIALSGVIQALVSFSLKRMVFPQLVRPKKFFEGKEVLSFIEGVDVASYYSFPSGHTMSAFLLAGLLSFIVRGRLWHILLMTLAVLVGVSRIYLLQHFFRDVLFGSLIGIALSYVMWEFFHKRLFKESS